MNEPSILDYLKLKLGMIKGEEVELLTADLAPSPEAPTPEIETPPPVNPSDFASRILTREFPFRSLMALLLALMGQLAFEPPRRGSTAGLIFYLAAFSMLILAYYRGEWHLPALRETETSPDNWLFKGIAFFLAFPLAIAAFVTFDDNSFEFLNTSLWLASLFLLSWSLWRSKEALGEKLARTKFSFSYWTVLVFIVTATLLFFRLYQIGSVPPEPFSDHAEKLLDVYSITQGELSVFFPRNTGREAIQMYWTLLVAKIFGTGISYLSLKLGTTWLGLLTLPYVYLLGKEIANKRVGLIAAFMMGISYWHNVISRVGLRFPLYPLFVAPTLFYLLRGIRRQNRNDFILAGIFLGLGAHGYSSFRIMPFVVVAAILLYLLHRQSKGARQQIIIHLFIVVLLSLIVFLPLGRYALENPHNFSTRAFSRLGYFNAETMSIFGSNVWDGIRMFNWDNGGIWVHSVTGRPALDVVNGALFLFGVVLLIIRYLRKRHWLDLFLLLSILLLQLPSTLSVAFPAENPSLNRTGGAAVVVFVIVGMAFDGLLSSLTSRTSRRAGIISAWMITILLVSLSLYQNYDLVFNKYAGNYLQSSHNTSEMGEIITQFEQTYGQTETVWIVPYKHWVDTRLPGVWAGIPNRDFALWQHDLEKSLDYEAVKLFMVKIEDEESLDILVDLYPNGILTRHVSPVAGRDFMIFSVP